MAAAVGTRVPGIGKMSRPAALKTLGISRTALIPATEGAKGPGFSSARGIERRLKRQDKVPLYSGGFVNLKTSMLLLASVAIAVTGCAGTPSATVTATVTETAISTPTAQTSPLVVPTQGVSSPAQTEASEVVSAPEPGVIVVPDMVGQNYQDAQDVWRASGLVVVPAEDATGANRLALLDSNWYVVAQTPSGGTEVEPGSSIQATIRKYSDD